MDPLEKALARIAALEARESSRPAPSTPNTGIDPQVLARSFAADPVGTMTKLGIPVDHVSRVLVAHALGDQAPPELRMLAQQGPLMSATQALASDLQNVRQRFEAFEERDQKDSRRKSFSALAADKSKYPLLAAAIAKNPELFNSDAESHKGDAAALAESIESRLKVLAPALGVTPPASQVNAETANADPSTQVKQAQSGVVDPTPPPIPQPKPGVFTPETHTELKERILRKYESGARG